MYDEIKLSPAQAYDLEFSDNPEILRVARCGRMPVTSGWLSIIEERADRDAMPLQSDMWRRFLAKHRAAFMEATHGR